MVDCGLNDSIHFSQLWRLEGQHLVWKGWFLVELSFLSSLCMLAWLSFCVLSSVCSSFYMDTSTTGSSLHLEELLSSQLPSFRNTYFQTESHWELRLRVGILGGHKPIHVHQPKFHCCCVTEFSRRDTTQKYLRKGSHGRPR